MRNSLSKSRLPVASVIPKNKRRLWLLIPFYLVLSKDHIFRDFRGFRVFDLAMDQLRKTKKDQLK